MMTESNVFHHSKPALLEGLDVLVQTCHAASVSSGWWTDLETGEDMRDPVYMKKYRLVQEKLSLIHSEIGEATEGHRKAKMDEHIPERTNFEVELADAVIRIADLAGAMNLDLSGAIVDKLRFNARRPDHKLANRKAEGGKTY
jgi:NTP pyrophosphatase (non-canonical NTP hydrolase)